LEVNGTAAVKSANPYLYLTQSGTSGQSRIYFGDSDSEIRAYTIYDHSDDSYRLSTAGSERLRIDSSGRLLVGTSTTSPAAALHVVTSGAGEIRHADGARAVSMGSTGTISYIGSVTAGNGLALYSANAEKARIDASGRLLVGASSGDGSVSTFQIVGNTGGNTGAQISLNRGAIPTAVSQTIGLIAFGDGSGDKYAEIKTQCDGAAAAGDAPGRLVFSTTADGASSPTERMRITSDGRIYSLPTYNNTAAASANMHVDSNGIFYRATSSAKYKTDIETLEDQYADALLNVRPVWYRSTTGNEPTDWSWYGFIAEEVAEIDPRLVHWKTVEGVPNEKGQIEYTELETPVAEGVQYERFVPHLLNLIKRQQQAIEELQVEVAALKAQ
jgi:hypothetical protein